MSITLIETERLILRPFTEEDEPVIRAIAEDTDTTRYLYWWGRDGWTPEADTQRFLYEHVLPEWQKQPVRCMEYAVVRKSDGAVMGDASIEYLTDTEGEIGWILLPEYRGQGYITEAGQALLRQGFEEMGLLRVVAHCDSRNVKSSNVMERLGMSFRQLAPGARTMKNGVRGDESTYAIEKAAWWWKTHGSESYVKQTRQKIGHDLLVFAGAGVFMYRDGCLLLQKRADDGTWSIHGGCVEPGERTEDTARREVEEETGLRCLNMRYVGTYSGENGYHTYPNGDLAWIIDTVYLCTEWEGEVTMQEGEVADLRWFPIDALPPQEQWPYNIYSYLPDCLKLIRAYEAEQQP